MVTVTSTTTIHPAAGGSAEPWQPTLWERLKWAPARLAIRTVGQLSDGVRLGQRYGFSSGEMLDYVYENQASGLGPIGRAIDRRYLDSPGWRGIRERRGNLTRILTALVIQRRGLGLTTRIVDVASGPGRYLIDVAAALGPADLSIECRDADRESLELGRSLAVCRGVANVDFVEHDALDARAIAAIRPRPDIVVVSGLYEILRDEVAIRSSLSGIAELLSPGGLLIVTGQPRHPQLELIRNLLCHRDGSPWAMHLRSTETLEGWTRSAGFVDPHTVADSQAIFTITVCRREQR